LLINGQEKGQQLKISVYINLLNIDQEKRQLNINVHITLAEHWPEKGTAGRGLYLLSLSQEKGQQLEVCVCCIC
jgi:hypothetical protein